MTAGIRFFHSALAFHPNCKTRRAVLHCQKLPALPSDRREVASYVVDRKVIVKESALQRKPLDVRFAAWSTARASTLRPARR